MIAASSVLVGTAVAPAGAGAQAAQISSGPEAPTSAPPALDPATDPALAPQAGGALFTTEGRGYGHGRGMGQYGAFGYATVWGASAPAILDWFYGGTSAGSIGTARDIRVQLIGLNSTWFVLASDRGDLITNATGSQRFRTLLVIPQPNNTFALYAGADCGGNGGWWYAGSSTPPIRFAIAGADPAAYDRGQWFGVCGAEGVRYYRGAGEAVTTTAGSRVVNHLPMEQYLRGVVPREMTASWASAANGAGMQALMAQAVAARSYAAAEKRSSLFDTCDTTTCQAYGGAALWSPSQSLLLEDARSDSAVAQTAGVVRLWPNGTVARTEFCSSTGGQTAGGAFTSVADWGDAVPSNPYWHWYADVSAAPLEKAFPALGTVTAITVTGRNGIGELGGRITTAVVTGTTGSQTLSGDDLRFYLDMRSDWFTIARKG